MKFSTEHRILPDGSKFEYEIHLRRGRGRDNPHFVIKPITESDIWYSERRVGSDYERCIPTALELIDRHILGIQDLGTTIFIGLQSSVIEKLEDSGWKTEYDGSDSGDLVSLKFGWCRCHVFGDPDPEEKNLKYLKLEGSAGFTPSKKGQYQNAPFWGMKRFEIPDTEENLEFVKNFEKKFAEMASIITSKMYGADLFLEVIRNQTKLLK